MNWNKYGECEGQLSLFDMERKKSQSCGSCICRSCFKWQQMQCKECGKHCSFGNLYPVKVCFDYVKFEEPKIKKCIGCNTIIFQDGEMHCPIVESVGCDKCMELLDEV